MAETNTLTKNEGLMGLFLRLRAYGIQDDALLKCVESVPREQFIPALYQEQAWGEECFPLPCGQILWSPDIAVRILNAAELRKTDTVLELGSGSGYLTALLARLTRKVRSLERYGKLVQQAKTRLQHLGVDNVVLEHADAYEALGDGLYDRIICDSCFTEIPEFLASQMVSGGIILTAIGEKGENQMLVRLHRVGSRLEREDLFPVRFTPLEKGRALAL